MVVQAKCERRAAIQERKSAEQRDSTLWESNVLMKSSMALRWMCALHIFAGLDYTIYACLVGKDAEVLWAALSSTPDWYAGLLMTMFAFAFGSKEIKKVGGLLAGSMRKKV